MSGDPASSGEDALKRNRSLWLVVPTFALLLGQAWAAWWNFSAIFLSVFLVPAALFLAYKRRKLAALVLLAGIAFSAGYLNHQRILYPAFSPDHLRSVTKENQKLYLEGILRQEPERFPQRSRWVIRAERLWHPTGAQKITGDILISIRHTAKEWRYGDRIRLWIEPQLPRGGGNPGGFDYGSFLARRQIYVTGFLENDEGVELLSREGAGLWSAVESLRREIRRFMDRHFSAENGALIKALVVGDMSGISKETRAEFTAAGVNHVVSISGLHVGMLGLVVFWLVRFGCLFSATLLLRWNLLKVATFLSFLAVLFYTLLAGSMVPTVRSAIMIGVYELAVLLDREEEVFTSLSFAALLIGLAWPGVILDISFQLSFLAVLFIIWGLRKIVEWLPAPRRDLLPQERTWLRRKLRPAGLYLVVPLLATIGTGPMIAYHFGHLSWAGFLANPMVVPLIGFVIVPLGLLIGFLSLVAPALALPFVWLAESLLSLAREMVHFFSRLPLATIAVPLPDLMEVGLLYILILSFLLFRRRLYFMVALGAVGLALAGDGLYWWQERWERKGLKVTYLDVGQGDAAVVEFPGSQVLLIDAGGTTSGEFDTGEAIIAPFLRSRKILKVDYVLVAHPRVDHYGGMATVVEEFSPSEFWSGPGKGRTARYLELEEAVERSKIKKVILGSGDPCRFIEQVKVCVLYSPEGRGPDASVVLQLSLDRANFLFPGDIERRDERALLMSEADLSSAVLKVPRHGSLGSSSEEFVAAVNPKLAIFSVGHRNRFGFPREEVISRYQRIGSKILRTDRDGAITVETDGESVRYWTYRNGKKIEVRW